MSIDAATMQREFLVSLWKIEVLSLAANGPVVGLEMLRDLRDRGYDVSPGTIYPLLRRMAEYGWLAAPREGRAHVHARREHHITDAGREVLDELRAEIARLHDALRR